MQIGVWCNKVTLPNLSAPLRTDQGLLSGQDLKHHSGKSPFVEIESFNMVSGFPLDYMHLVCLGVVRRLINLWINLSLAENTSNIDTGVSDDACVSGEVVSTDASNIGEDRAVIKKRRRHA